MDYEEVFTVEGKGGEGGDGNPNIKFEEDPGEKRRRLLMQGWMVFLSSLGMWCFGCELVFPSVVAGDLRNHNTTIYGTTIFLTNTEIDMLGSLPALASLPGNWMFAPLMMVFGRKISMIMSAILFILGWLGVTLLPGVTGMLVGRCISGFAVGGASVSILSYAIELADPEVRGIMGLIVSLGIFAGQVVTMGVGYSARYFTVALINLVIPTAFLISQIWLPESPSFLVVKGRVEEARAVLSKLRGRFADLDAEIQGYIEMNQSTQGRSLWREMFKPEVLKSIAVLSILFILMNFTGAIVVNANASRMFSAAGSTVNANLAAIIVTIVELMGGGVAFILIDRLGRRTSLILSFGIMCVPLAILSAYVGIVDQDQGYQIYGWIPLVCLMVSQTALVLGVNPIPYILSNEYFPTSIRSQAVSIIYTIGTLSGFAVLQLYTPMREGLTQTGLYAFYSAVCAVGIPFTFFFIKETMGQKVG